MGEQPVTVLIPAYQAADTIAATVRAARGLPGVGRVVVVDDGSRDDTARQAEQAGAEVIRHRRNRGKGAALRTAAWAAGEAPVVLLLDADLGESAGAAGRLLAPVREGATEMAIALLPPSGKGGGFGLAVRSARTLIHLLTGESLAAPLSGQRALTGPLLRQVRIADRFAVEVALTLDALLLGARVAEVPAALAHRVTGWSPAHLRHRGRQLLDVWRAALPRALYPFDAAGRPAPARRGVICAGLVGAAALGLALLPGAWPRWLGSWLLLGLASVVGAWWFCRGGRLVRPNYRKQEIPAAMGLAVALFAAGNAVTGLPGGEPLGLATGTGFAALGLADDYWGSREVGGFAGHLRALRAGRLTTGTVKLLGGAALALAVGWLRWGQVLPALVDGALIALCANAVNLLDVRPGRAVKAWLLLALLAAASPESRPLVVGLAVMLAWYAPLDLGGKAMLGDTGANALGAMAGLALAFGLGWPSKVALVGLLLVMQVVAEWRSLGELVEGNRVLGWLDRLGRRDLPPDYAG